MDSIQNSTLVVDTFLLRRLIAAKGMTTREFAVSIGLSPFTIWRTLSGKSTPSIKTLKQICENLNVAIADLLAESLNKKRS